MDQPDWDLPEELHSEYEERPFKICTRCGESLADFDEGFQISKVFRNGECTMEYAICMPCHSSMVSEFSVDSRRKMEKFQEENFKHADGLFQCAVCAVKRTDDGPTEYGLAAHCLGLDLVQDLMICGKCTERMQEMISPETRGRWDKFVGENFPCAPSETSPAPTGVPVF